jgi:N-methylhydantoinase A
MAAALTQAVQQFHALHEQYSGHAMPDQPIDVVALRVRLIGATGQQPTARLPEAMHAETPAPLATVTAYLDSERTEPVDTALYDRAALPPGARIAGPAILLQMDTTTVVPPDWQAVVGPAGHILLTHTT